MSDKMSQSNDQPPSQHGRQDNRPDAPDLLFRPPLPTDDGWEYYRRGPQLLASIGNWSWIRRASRERLARQRKGHDGEYIHHWWIKDQCSTKTPAIAKDAQALANTWGRPLHRSRDEPEAEPVFSPTEIRFNAPESGCDDFRYPPDRSENEQAGQPAGRLRLLQHGHDALRPAGRRHHADHQVPPRRRRGGPLRRRPQQRHLGRRDEPIPEDVPGARRAQPRQLARRLGTREVSR